MADLTEAAQTLYDALDPAFTTGAEDVAAGVCSALVTGNLNQILAYVGDTDERPGWQILFDPANCPVEALPYLAQFGGAILRPDMDEAQQRAAISDPEVFHRGMPAQIVAVAKRRLTGTKTVLLVERYTDNAYRMQIVTLPSETPYPDVTEAEIRAEAKPIGDVLYFNDVVPWTWGELAGEESTWADVAADFDTWADVASFVP